MNEAERVTNGAAELLSVHDGKDARPALQLGLPGDADGDAVLVFAYWSDGELVVTVDTEDAADRVIPVRINVNNDRGAYRTEVRP